MPKRPSLEDQIKSAQIVVKAVGDLVPYAKNAKLHNKDQVEFLAKTIKRFGWTNPCIITSTGEVIAGHGRLLAAEKLGLAEVPCIVMDHLSRADIKMLRIADNTASQKGGGWDSDNLRLELYHLNMADSDLSFTGLDQDYIAAALNKLTTEEIDTQQIDSVNRDKHRNPPAKKPKPGVVKETVPGLDGGEARDDYQRACPACGHVLE